MLYKLVKEAPVGGGCFTLFDHHVSLSRLLDFSSIEVSVRASWIIFQSFSWIKLQRWIMFQSFSLHLILYHVSFDVLFNAT